MVYLCTMATATKETHKKNRFSRERLKLVRQSRGMNHEDFGQAIGRTGRSVRNWEDGKTSPTMQDLEAIADAFQIDLGFFITKPTPH